MDLVFSLILVILHQATPLYGKSLPDLREAFKNITNNENEDITDLLNKIKEQNIQNVHFQLYSDLEGLKDTNFVQLKSKLQKKGDNAPFAIIIARNDIINENSGTDKEENSKEKKENIIQDVDKSAVALKINTKKEHVSEDQASKKVEISYPVKNKDSYTYNDDSFTKEVHAGVRNELKPNASVTVEDIQDKQKDSYTYDNDSFTKEVYKGIRNEFKPNASVIVADILNKQAGKTVDITFKGNNEEKENDVKKFIFNEEKQGFEDVESKSKGNSSSFNRFKNKLANIPNTLAEDTASLHDSKSADILRNKQKFLESLKFKNEDVKTAKDNQNYSKDMKHTIDDTDFAQVYTEQLKIQKVKNNTDKHNYTRHIDSERKILLKEILRNEEESKKEFTKSNEPADTEHNEITFEDNISEELELSNEEQPKKEFTKPYELADSDEDDISKESILQPESMIGNRYENLPDDKQLIEQTIEDGVERDGQGKIVKNYINIACKTEIRFATVRDNNSKIPTCYISFDFKI